MRVLRQIARGGTTLPHVGSHPGTGWLFAFILMGAYAGASNGGEWWGALGGAGITALGMVPLYLFGAYDRAQLSDRLVREALTPQQAADAAIADIIRGWKR